MGFGGAYAFFIVVNKKVVMSAKLFESDVLEYNFDENLSTFTISIPILNFSINK